MNIMIALLIAAVAIVPTVVELRRDGAHRLDEGDCWRGLGSHW